jgi:hypothetical protein
MSRKLVITSVFAFALAAVTFGSAPVAAGPSTTSIIAGTKTIDGYRVGAGYAQAHRIFGLPYSSEQDSARCTARWGNGVTISWHRTLPSSKWAKACVKFSSARVGKPSVANAVWRTNKGLRVGARAAQIKSLYPSARGKRSGIYTVWILQKSPTISLNAWVKKGKIAFFRLIHT